MREYISDNMLAVALAVAAVIAISQAGACFVLVNGQDNQYRIELKKLEPERCR